MADKPDPEYMVGLCEAPAANSSEGIALRCASSPLVAMSPYHAFAKCSSIAFCCQSSANDRTAKETYTTVRMLWDEATLYVCWELEGLRSTCLPPPLPQHCFLDVLLWPP